MTKKYSQSPDIRGQGIKYLFMSLTIAYFLIFSFLQNTATAEQKAIDHFREHIYLNPDIYKNPCKENDQDCLYLGTLIPDKFIEDKFLEGFQLFVNPVADQYPDNITFPDSAYLRIEGQGQYERQKRVYDTFYSDKGHLGEVYIDVKKPFFSTKDVPYDFTDDYGLYVVVSKAIYTGQEYFVELIVFSHYNSSHNHEDSFGYRFTFDNDLKLVHTELFYY